MRVILVSRTLPAPTGVGSSVHVWSVLESLSERGHKVRLCLCTNLERADAWRQRMFQQTAGDLASLGIDVQFLKSPPRAAGSRLQRWVHLLRKMVAPTPADFYPEVRYEAELAAQIDSWSADALCLWEIEAVAATRNLAPALPRLAFFTDPDHLIRQYRRRYRPARNRRDQFYRKLDQIAERKLPSLIVKLLQDCEVVVDHAAHHAEWFRSHGVPQTIYLPVPVIDRIGEEWAVQRAALAARRLRPRILLVGSLAGVATISGLRLFAFHILPTLERWLGPDTFEVHVVGGGQLPADLTEAFNRPSVRLRGYVDDVHTEFLSCDVLLVPTDSDMGFRTRIAEGMSFGCCIVAHTANGLGMPELRHEVNSLVASEGPELAKLVARCLRDEELRARLRHAGRQTFVHELDGRLVCHKMIHLLEAAGHGHSTERLDLRSQVTTLPVGHRVG